MDIPSLSIAMAQSQVMQQASVSLAKKVMDLSEVQAQGIVEMMQTAAPPSGHQLDIRV